MKRIHCENDKIAETRALKKPRRPPSIVYLLVTKLQSDNRILGKIGITCDVTERMKELNNACFCYDLELIGTLSINSVWGSTNQTRLTHVLETILHGIFNPWRAPGGREWFYFPRECLLFLSEFFKAELPSILEQHLPNFITRCEKMVKDLLQKEMVEPQDLDGLLVDRSVHSLYISEFYVTRGNHNEFQIDNFAKTQDIMQDSCKLVLVFPQS